jgi:3-oxoadipate enol-lactonase
MPKVRVNGIDLFYDIKGKGEPLLLIAGFLCDHTYWSLLMPSLVNHYQVIRLDNRGIARSVTPGDRYSILEMASDAAALLEYLGFDQAHVVGHSMGGQIAQELALAYPEKVQSLILLSSLAKGDPLFNSVIASWGDLAHTLETKMYQQVILPWIFTDTFYSTPGMIEMILDLSLYNPFPPSPQRIYHQSRAIIAADTKDRLKHIHCPTLVVVGKQDILTPLKYAKELAQGIPKAELIILDAGGHGFLIESPESVASAILQFLSTR